MVKERSMSLSSAIFDYIFFSKLLLLLDRLSFLPIAHQIFPVARYSSSLSFAPISMFQKVRIRQ